MSPRPASPEELLIRRTARRIAVRTAALFTVALLAIIVLAAVLVVRTQHSDALRQLNQAIADSDAVSDPPVGILIYQSEQGVVRASTELRGGAPVDPGAFDRVSTGGTADTREVSLDGRRYLVATGRRDGAVVQAALDLTDQERERDRLMRSLVAAGVVGLLVSALVGWLIARRAIRPLGTAIDRQHRFVADASHELRTPVTQVHTRAQLLRRAVAGLPDRPDLAADAEHLVRGTRQLGDILAELLDAAQLRTAAGGFDTVDAAEVAAEAVDAEQPRARQSGVTLTFRRDGGPHLVDGARTALTRVLNSLIDNALGHTGQGGSVAVEACVRGDNVVWAVSDDGVGFDPARAEEIFDRFARGTHGTGRRYGLGLALVREVVDAHRGKVTAESPPDGGATFTVSLPASRPR